jgi:hypothetical protein
MVETTSSETVAPALGRAADLEAGGDLRAAIDVLTEAARAEPRAGYLRELVRLRRAAGRAVLDGLPAAGAPSGGRDPIAAEGSGGEIVEVDAADLTPAAIRDGIARCGCLLVRGLLDADRAERLARGIDATLESYDVKLAGSGDADPAWYDPGAMPDRIGSDLPEAVHRKFLRGRGSAWTADSPRMLFEVFEFVDDSGFGRIMTEFLGERPLLSGLKATLRRIPVDVDTDGRWHQDGSFLGEHVDALNIWVALSPCGRDSPGLDIVARRLERVLADDAARYDWAVSDDAVVETAGGAAIIRPEFEAGDALLFDQILLHRTGASAGMTRERYAIESWFFAPSAYPTDHVPILY